MDTNTGGPAFPTSDYLKGNPVSAYFTGLTVRDYFAAAALTGWLSNTDLLDAIDRIEDGCEAKAQIARTMYSIADHMLEERMKCQSGPSLPMTGFAQQ